MEYGDMYSYLIDTPACSGTEKCFHVTCAGAYTPEGGCCQKCPVSVTCTHYGVTYQSGDTFNEACNTCTCNNGALGCTKISCDPCQYVKCPNLRCLFNYKGKCCKKCLRIRFPWGQWFKG